MESREAGRHDDARSHDARVREAARAAARQIRAPGTSFQERPRAYIVAIGLTLALAGLIILLSFASAFQPPLSKRAFVPDWRCDHYDVGAEVCERVQHTTNEPPGRPVSAGGNAGGR
jgi:hypothetical protein